MSLVTVCVILALVEKDALKVQQNKINKINIYYIITVCDSKHYGANCANK